VRDRDQRIGIIRALLPHERLDDRGEPVCGEHGDGDEHERQHTPVQERDDDREREPDEPVGADPRQPDEDMVERLPAVVDDPPLGCPVPAGQSGAICFVWSISCCRSNGLPMNPCAPCEAASCSAASSSLPLNITTGIAPAP
jgi:hypothetical protein